MMDEEATKRYVMSSEKQKEAGDQRGSKVQVGQEEREITVLPQRKTDESAEIMAASESSCGCCMRLRERCPRPHGLISLLITKVCLFALLFGVVWSITGRECLPGGNLFGIIILFICSVLGGKLVGMIQLPTLPPFPPLLGMLLAGLVLRNVPYITDAVFIDTHWSSSLRSIALSIILTRAGLGLDPSALRRLKTVCVRLAIGPCVVEASIIAVVSHFLLALPWVWGFILGFVLAAVSPAVVVPSMLLLQREGYGVEKGIPTLLMAAGSFDDILAITGFSTCLGIAFSTGSTWMNILKGLLEVVGGVIAGLILGLFLCCFPSRDQEDLVLRRTLMLLGLSIFSVFFSHVIGFAGAGGLCTLVLAFLAALGWKTDKAPVAAMLGRSWDVFQPLLFGLIGAEITIAKLSPSTVGLGLACISVGLVVRLFVTFLLVHFGGFNLKEKVFIAVAWLPKATVQVCGCVAPEPQTPSGSTETPNQEQNLLLRPLTVQLMSCLCVYVSGRHRLQGVGHGEGGRRRNLDKVWIGCANVSSVSYSDHGSHWSAGYRTGRPTPPCSAGQSRGGGRRNQDSEQQRDWTGKRQRDPGEQALSSVIGRDTPAVTR